MPKHKKQPKNAMYFYIADRKKELERKGNRFPRGIQDVFSLHGHEWKDLPNETKEKYKDQAKEEKEKDKLNLHNKFTNTGESYAQVEERQKSAIERAKKLNDRIEKLAWEDINGRCPEERVYIIIKCVNYVEDIVPGKETVCPAEIALAAFSLSSGLKAVYSTLVDIVTHPFAYADAVKNSCKEYGLLIPGCHEFQEQCRKYDTIFEHIKKFTEYWLLEDYGEEFTYFCMPDEIESTRLSLTWIIQNMIENNQEEAKQFLSDLEFCDLTTLMIKMAEYGKRINPNYSSPLADYKLGQDATYRILNKSSYDFNIEITCIHHRQWKNGNRMKCCSRNLVIRRIYLICHEFCEPYGIEKSKGHDAAILPKVNPPRPSTRTCFPSGRSSRRSSSDESDRKPGSSFCYADEKHSAKKYKNDDASSSSSKFYPSPNTSVFDNEEHQDYA